MSWVEPGSTSDVHTGKPFSPCRSSAMGTARVIDPKDLVTRWTSPRMRGAKSDLESARNVLILKWLPQDL
jgi:hypothetical protein